MDIIEFEGRKVPATYLGDGVYAVYDGYGYWLRVGDHRNKAGQIYVEPPVLNNLRNFATECNRLRQATEKENEKEESSNLASTNNP